MPTKKQVIKSIPVENPIETTVNGLVSELNSAKLENKKRPAPIASAPTITKSVIYSNSNIFTQPHTHLSKLPGAQVKIIVQSKAPVELSAPQTNPNELRISNMHNFRRQEQQSLAFMSPSIPWDNSDSFESILPDSVSPLNNLVPVNSYSSQYSTDALYHINKKRKVVAESSCYNNYSQVSYYNNNNSQSFATCKPADVNENY